MWRRWNSGCSSSIDTLHRQNPFPRGTGTAKICYRAPVRRNHNLSLRSCASVGFATADCRQGWWHHFLPGIWSRCLRKYRLPRSRSAGTSKFSTHLFSKMYGTNRFKLCDTILGCFLPKCANHVNFYSSFSVIRLFLPNSGRILPVLTEKSKINSTKKLPRMRIEPRKPLIQQR